MTLAPTHTEIATPDGARLAGRLFLGAEKPELAVVIHAATGVPQGYYEKFAAWLAAEKRAAVLTYDYSDYGLSATGSVRASKATMAQWGVRDQSAALDHLIALHPDLPVWVVGHSLGGMYVPFHAQAERVERVIAVASGPAYWLKHPLAYMPQVVAFWFMLGPIATKLLGYLPGKALGLGADLPREVYWQWRRWCVSPTFNRVDWGKALPVPDLSRVKAEVKLVGVADDPMIPPHRVRKLAEFYPAAKISHLVVEPRAVGARSIGHLKLFAERNASAWPLLLARA